MAPDASILPPQADIVERRFPRFRTQLPCLYSKDGGPDWNGTVINLSHGGCAIEGRTPVDKGDYLRVLLFPSAVHDPIEVGLAPVRWTSGQRFGLEFITLTQRDAYRLRGYLAFIETEA